MTHGPQFERLRLGACVLTVLAGGHLGVIFSGDEPLRKVGRK